MNDVLERKLQRAAFGSHVKTIVAFVAIIVVFTGILFFLYRTKNRLSPPEYEGRIEDKWVGYTHTETGTRPYFRLLVESPDGQKFPVAVDQETYERAKVGMRIKKTPTGVELTEVSVLPS